jgi:Peptidase S24-like
MIDARSTLDQLIRENREDYSALSRMIGRNPSYIQQFIKRGSPRRLGEGDRRTLARYFGVSERLLGGFDSNGNLNSQMLEVPLLEIGCRMHHGIEKPRAAQGNGLAFDKNWLQKITGSNEPDVCAFRVTDDTMEPTIRHNDQALVDLRDGSERLRDGIYLIQIDHAIHIKRVTISPIGEDISIASDNHLYAGWEALPRSAVSVVGRIVWIGRTLI